MAGWDRPARRVLWAETAGSVAVEVGKHRALPHAPSRLVVIDSGGEKRLGRIRPEL